MMPFVFNDLYEWQRIWYSSPPMTGSRLISTMLAVAASLLVTTSGLGQTPPTATFKSGVDLVRVTAVVRDHKGRFINDLSARDFETLDGRHQRAILDFRSEAEGISLALLFDVSGSMEARLADAREAGGHILSWLDASRDEA